MIGGVLQLGLCLLAAWRIEHLPIFRHRLRAKELRAFWWVLLPGIVSALCLQFNLIVSRAFASTLQEGAIIWLFFAERMFQLPLALIGISLGVALLPTLSRAISAGDQTRVDALRRQTQHAALLLALPAAVALAVCADFIIDVLFARGAFGAEDTHQSARALQALALGLPAYILVKILQPLFFARHNTKTPMFIAMGMMMVNVILAAILMRFLAHTGLALATALAGWTQVFLLLLALKRRRIVGLAVGMIGFGLRVAAASGVMALVLLAGLWLREAVFPGLSNFSVLLLLVSFGGISYLVATLVATGYKWCELRALFQKF
ncbi:MAG: polysaccharide biosynthesis C-terminal domain-containing protein [Alphaproteobacteria bacterium]|nr:polysaccharide biosynthesis C-terminal domain-containing protein [Alphaproteobacteria bacterium]